MNCGRVRWQEAEETRKDFNIVLIHQDKKFFVSELVKVIQDASFITWQCINSEQFLRCHLSHRMCNQVTFHHRFRIDTRRTKFEQKTDGSLYVCGSYEQRVQRSGQNWPGSTASRNSHTGEKWIRGNTDDDWINDTNAQSDKHNNMFNVAANLKYVETHEDTNWRLVSALSLFVL